MTDLAGRVVITADADVARAVAPEGATVVLVGADASAFGALVDEVRQLGGRAAVLVGDLTDEATRTTLTELLHELFPTP
ncbi:MAG: hypothetical protein ABWY77_02800 [Acidimicrobiia bacterium]